MSTILNKYRGTLDDGEIPLTVYKYRNWDDDFHKRFILEREVFMAFPESFEDKLDCKLPIRYDLLNERQILQWAMRMSKLKFPSYNRSQHRLESKTWMKEKKFKDKIFLDDYHKFYSNEHNKRRGILSLTAEPCIIDMWAKYANDSQGFCIGYNSRIMFNYLGGGGKVTYYDTLPDIFPEPIMEHLEIHALQIFSKEKKWEFENEYRTHKFWENPTGVKERQIKLPNEAFQHIILGRNISSINRTEIITAVNDNIGDIPIYDQDEFCSM
ncbi:DUF2971 domain-containing protein [Flavobacterium sp. J372]|uniref:DUF2971 domain-containing protein n=1 Tax=Flavobacterium sp. J372 TaxID=2898436 RepID=UPI00215172CE|nr:DUF2971 domain-containing protein [Flavobacterium sp. J372]MCR5861915.1 DUF2971 domain-containing protein [Flavobacterium sp. J372]